MAKWRIEMVTDDFDSFSTVMKVCEKSPGIDIVYGGMVIGSSSSTTTVPPIVRKPVAKKVAGGSSPPAIFAEGSRIKDFYDRLVALGKGKKISIRDGEQLAVAVQAARGSSGYYLNDLYRLGKLQKEYRGRVAFFWVPE